MNRIKWALVLMFGLTLFLVPFVSAHSFIDHCTPEVGSTVAQAPKQIRCVFTDPIDPKQTVMSVFDTSNNQVDNKDLKPDTTDLDGKTVFLTLNTAQITGGLYTVKWSTVSEDGHATDGQWQFSVAAAQAAPTAAPTIAPTIAPTTTQTTTTPVTPSPTPTKVPTAVPALPASVTILSPDDGSSYPDDPADVVVGIQTNNFKLGQGTNRWQVYLDGKLMLQVMDNSTSVVLHAVPGGDHWVKVALATGDNTVVATAGAGIGVGPSDGDTPLLALTNTCTWQSLDGGGETWYKIPYQKGTQLEITLDNNGAGIGFDVWDPWLIQTWNTPDQTFPTGSGSPNAAEPSHDLTWVGHLPDNGMYYVHLSNNDSDVNKYRLCYSASKLP